MVSDKEILEYIPVHKCDFTETDGIVTVLYFRENKSFLDRFLFRKLSDKPSKIDFDRTGSVVWKLINGRDNISSIIENAKIKFGNEVEPAEQRVIIFIRKLAGTKLIELYKKR